jgi:hypothetical protein
MQRFSVAGIDHSERSLWNAQRASNVPDLIILDRGGER